MNRSSITPPKSRTIVASGDSISINLVGRRDLVEGGQLLSHCTIVNNDLVTQPPSLDACTHSSASEAEKKSSSSPPTLIPSPATKSSDLNIDPKQTLSSSVSVSESVPIAATANATDAEALSKSQAKPQEQQHIENNESQDKALNQTLDDTNRGTTIAIDHIETTGQLQLHPPPRPNSSSDPFAANQGRDMHHLSVALNILGDLDDVDFDDTDSDDDVEDEAEALHISLPQ